MRFHKVSIVLLLLFARADLSICLVSKIFPDQSAVSFHAAVRQHLLSELDGLDPAALLTVKRLIRAGLTDKNDPDAVNLRESYGERRLL